MPRSKVIRTILSLCLCSELRTRCSGRQKSKKQEFRLFCPAHHHVWWSRQDNFAQPHCANLHCLYCLLQRCNSDLEPQPIPPNTAHNTHVPCTAYTPSTAYTINVYTADTAYNQGAHCLPPGCTHCIHCLHCYTTRPAYTAYSKGAKVHLGSRTHNPYMGRVGGGNTTSFSSTVPAYLHTPTVRPVCRRRNQCYTTTTLPPCLI